MSKIDETKEGFFGTHLPGTGGDYIDDTEGKALRTPKIPSPDGGDVEGHLYRGGPTTQGEFVRRGPGENPHGER